MNDLMEKYNHAMLRMCKEYCYWRISVYSDYCKECPLWQFKADLHKALEILEDDGK